jgi:5'(3')-deoxyribonucleotidase
MTMYGQRNNLLVDMDGVLTDTMGSAFNLIEQEDGITLCHYDVKDYWFDGMPVTPDRIIDIFRTEGFYRNLDVITGAVKAVNRLREKFDVVVCSAPLKGAEHCEDDKREWLAEHFDNDLAESAIITPDKTKVEGKLLIEDNPEISRDASWRPLLFDQPWNRSVMDLDVMYGWGDMYYIYKRMEG